MIFLNRYFMFLICITTAVVILTGCDAQEIEAAIQAANTAEASAGTTTGTGTCTYILTSTYAVQTDPARDFNSQNTSVTSQISDSTCLDVSEGNRPSYDIPEIERQANTIHIQESSDQFNIIVQSDQLTMESTSTCLNSEKRISKQLVAGEISSTEGLLILEIQYTYATDSTCGESGNAASPVSPP